MCIWTANSQLRVAKLLQHQRIVCRVKSQLNLGIKQIT
uniref:Uncharacterized protein n=1 Tax=Anguilla anguilla TaxID=7936 RepID=A0A0E9TQB2_ANGAN